MAQWHEVGPTLGELHELTRYSDEPIDRPTLREVLAEDNVCTQCDGAGVVPITDPDWPDTLTWRFVLCDCAAGEHEEDAR